jgi:multidrug resistance efflux pump
LNLLCQMLPNAAGGIVAEIENGSSLPVTVCWPEGSQVGAEYHGAVAATLRQSAPVVQGQVFAHPLHIDGRLFAVVALEVAVEEKRRVMVQSLLGWGEQWLRLLLDPGAAVADSPVAAGSQHTAILPAIELALLTEPLHAAVLALNDLLAGQFACQRVVLGLVRGKGVRVQGFSHGLEFDPRTHLILGIEAAMDEVREAAAMRLCPDPDPSRAPGACPALEQLWLTQGEPVLCALPLIGQGGIIGVLLCERQAGEAFSALDLAALETLGRMLGHVLELKQVKLGAAPRRAVRALNAALDRLLKPGHRGFKLSVAGSLLLVLFLVFAQGTYRVGAQAKVEGLIQRAVVVPFDGYVAEAFARAGDSVEAGQEIARLDDRELLLELRKSTSEEDKLNNEYRKALAGLDRSEAGIVQSRLAQAQAQSQLLRQKLERLRLGAPLAGTIVSGDLSRSLGAPVEQGQVLFEVAPLAAYRLVLQIDERDIAEMKVGQRGVLTLTSMPRERWPFVLEQISPVFTELDDRVSFRTEARLEGDITRLRPGMEGLGKVDIGPRSFGWILAHDLLDWLRLQWWLWLP